MDYAGVAELADAYDSKSYLREEVRVQLPPPAFKSLPMSELVCIKICRVRPEAEIIKSLLESNNIKATISADDCGGMFPPLTLNTGGIKIMVEKENAQKAKDILKES